MNLSEVLSLSFFTPLPLGWLETPLQGLFCFQKWEEDQVGTERQTGVGAKGLQQKFQEMGWMYKDTIKG